MQQIQQDQATRSLFTEALALHQAGRLPEAERIYRQILASDPNNFDCLHLLGVIFAQNGNYVAAIDHIDRALKTNPTSTLALDNRGNALLALRRFEEAVASYDYAIALRLDSANTYFNRGNALHELKRYEQALASYDRALALRPDHVDAHANRGVTLLALQRFEAALASCDRALALHPASAEMLSNRGLALHKLKRFDEALASHDRALALKPDYAEAHYNRANALLALERLEEALAAYDHVLTLQQDYPEALLNRGSVLDRLKRFEEAVANYDRAIALRLDSANTHTNRGNALHELKRHEEALASYDRALALQPDHVDAHYNRANALLALERIEEALAGYDRVLALRQNYLEALLNRSSVLERLKRFEEALASCDRIVALKPDHAEAHLNRAAALLGLKRLEEALASCDRALALKPDYVEAHYNRGVILRELGRFDEVLASYGRAIALRPDFADAHFNEALCRLLVGDFERGWQKHEWRWQTDQLANERRNFPQPLWLGSGELAGKTILLHAEQGFGDTLQFCRYVPLVAARGARVILEVQPSLQDLMRTLAGPAQVICRGERLPAFDLHCPLLSLPLALQTRLDTIPARTPYLAAPENKVRAWRDRLGRHERPRIGLVWAGNPRKEQINCNQLDALRSMEFAQLAPLLEVSGCEFYSLQKGDDAVAQLHDSILREHVVDWTGDLHDFSDTAALIENLDLVITVDTAVAHLVGALNRPIWLLNRYNTCWRWLLDREDSPWYPTARLFRQDATRAWDNVLTRVRAALLDRLR